MNRRRFLAAAGIGVAGVSGCAGLGDRTLEGPRIEREDDGETHLHFGGEERVATLTVQPDHVLESAPYGVRVSLWHRDGTRVTDLTVGLRVPADLLPGTGEVYLKIPQWQTDPGVSLYDEDDRDLSIIDFEDLGSKGRGTVTVELAVDPLADLPVELLADVRFGLEREGLLGGRARGEGRVRVPLSA